MQDFKVYQVDCKVFLTKNISLTHVLYEIASFVNRSFSFDAVMLQLHKSKSYKNYVLSGFREIEKDKLYKEGKLYTFSVRCVDKKLCDFFQTFLADNKTASMKGLTTSFKVIPKLYIERLYSVTPVLLKLPNSGYWKGKISFTQFEKRLYDNAIKKYQTFTGEKVNDEILLYNRIQFLNQKPISNSYKNGIHLLGDKIELFIADNELSQNIAYMLLGVGALENSSNCYGYMNFKAM